MTWLKKRVIYRMILSVVVAVVGVGCGVKGDPLPPEKPVELGRGRPNYRRATEGLKVNRSKQGTNQTDDRAKVEQENEDEDGE